MPEPRITHEGTEQNDGERHAAQRFMAKVRQDPPHLTCIVTAEGRSAHAPPIDTLHDDGCHAILGSKEGDHGSLVEPGQAAEAQGRVTYDARHERAARMEHRLRFVHDVPLNASRADVRVPCMESWEVSQGPVQHCSGVTDWPVSKRNV